MRSMIINAQYKGETNDAFTHGQSYWLRVTYSSTNMVIVYKQKERGDDYDDSGEPTTYGTVVSFLFNWTEISSYDTVG